MASGPLVGRNNAVPGEGLQAACQRQRPARPLGSLTGKHYLMKNSSK
jgi:hypothetical protein